MTTTRFDAHIERITAGDRLSADDIRELARTPDSLPLGMLAAAEVYVRRRGAQRVLCAKLDHFTTRRCIFRCRWAQP